MNDLEKYMNDYDIVNEPMPLRELHAIRFMIHDEMKDMSFEERAQCIHEHVQKMIDEYGFKVKRMDSRRAL